MYFCETRAQTTVVVRKPQNIAVAKSEMSAHISKLWYLLRKLTIHIESITLEELDRKLGKPIRFYVREAGSEANVKSVIFNCDDKKKTIAGLLKEIQQKV